MPATAPIKAKTYTSARDHKRLKTSHEAEDAAEPEVNIFKSYLQTNRIRLQKDKNFDCI